MKQYLYVLLFLAIAQIGYEATAQIAAPAIAWQKTLGGNDSDVLTAVCIGAKKTIVLCGYSNSNPSGNKSDSAAGGYDYWVIKLDSAGNTLWNKTYGGNDDDIASAIINTSDGGYLVGGSSISDKSGKKTDKSYGFSYDYWVLKLNGSGKVLWNKTLGGQYTDQLTSLAELPAGGFVIGGYTYSNANGSKTTLHKGPESNADYWVVILNNDGTERTQYEYGDNSHDVLACVAPAGMGGFYAAGYSYSNTGNGKTKKNLGNNDYWIVRSDSAGKVQYEGNFGGTLSDYMTCMQVLPDSSIILGGYSNSPKSKSKSKGFLGVTDFWLVKLKPDGTKQWDKTIGGRSGDSYGGDYLASVQQTKDMGFILGGYSDAHKGYNKTEGVKGGFDYWIVKVDSLGNTQWDKTIGGSGDDILTGVYEADSGHYIVAGTSASPLSGSKDSGIIGGGSATDYWVLDLKSAADTMSKLALNTTAMQTNNAPNFNKDYKLDILPNPVKDKLTIQYSAPANAEAKLIVYAANGKPVLQSVLANRGGTASFHVGNLSSGSYFTVLYAGTVKLTKLFTKD